MTCHQTLLNSENWTSVVVGFEPTSLQDTCKDKLEYKQLGREMQDRVREKWFQA
mgnify:CR=1 FL=1